MPLHNTSVRFTDYFNRILAKDGVEAVLFRAGKPLQSAELNEVQSVLHRRVDSVADAVFQNGDIIEGSELFILEGDVDGNIETEDGRIYVQGTVYSVAGEKQTISFDKKVEVGLRFRFYEVDEVDVPSLLDPAIGRANFGEGGAGRRMSEFYWGWRADDETEDARASWDFFPIYEVDHGVIVIKSAPGGADPFVELVARYDRESNGNYLVSGLRPSFVEDAGLNYIFDVTEGVADIFGYKVERRSGTRLTWAKNFDVTTSNNEPHVYVEDGDGKFRLRFNRPPMATLGEIIGTKQKTVTVARGAFSGGSDQMPDSTVVAVVTVSQGATLFVAGRDYVVSGDTISWGPSGAGAIEPAPGSSYSVVYQYSTTLTPLETYDDYIVLTGCVASSLVYVDYDYKLPRIDVIAMNRDGTISRIVGVSQLRNPSAPLTSPDQIELGQVTFDWTNPPVVAFTAIRAIPMSELEDMRQNIDNLFELVAIERLKTNVAVTDPTSKIGVFVDAFYDDDLRDQGIDQSAAIVNGTLLLSNVPSAVEPSETATLRQNHLLPFNLEVILQQNTRSRSMKINPYQSFDVLPSAVRLTPSSDRWVEWQYTWTSPASAIVHLPQLSKGILTSVTKSVQTRRVSVNFANAQFIRQRTVSVNVKGFLPNEVVSAMTFDSISLPV